MDASATFNLNDLAKLPEALQLIEHLQRKVDHLERWKDRLEGKEAELDRFYSPRESARIANVSTRTLGNWRKAGLIEGMYTLESGAYCYQAYKLIGFNPLKARLALQKPDDERA